MMLAARYPKALVLALTLTTAGASAQPVAPQANGWMPGMGRPPAIAVEGQASDQERDARLLEWYSRPGRMPAPKAAPEQPKQGASVPPDSVVEDPRPQGIETSAERAEKSPEPQ